MEATSDAGSGHRHVPPSAPTLADVAERAGVSRQTVSNAVNNPDLLRADTLRAGAGGDRRARLPRPTGPPATCAPAPRHLDRAADEPGPGGHGQRGDGPLRALAGLRPRARPATTCCSSRARAPTRSAGYDDLLRSTAVDAFVVTDTYLGNPQAAWLRERRAPFVAFGRPWDDPDARAPVGRRRRRGRHRAGHRPPARQGPHSGSPGSAGARTPGSARTAAPAGAAPCATRGLSTTGLASRVEDTVCSGREASAVLLDEARPIGVRLRLRHPRHGRAPHPRRARARTRAATSPSSASTTPRSPRSCTPGLTSVRQPLEEVAVEVVARARGACSATPPHAVRRACCSPRR